MAYKGRGQSGKGMTEWRLDHRNRPKKTGETVDRHQNNGSVKAVSPRHCPATCALHNCCAWTESQRQCPLHCCWWTIWTTRSKRGPTCSAQLYFPTHDLFWADLKVQLHLPPLRSLDLFWSRSGIYSGLLWGIQPFLVQLVLSVSADGAAVITGAGSGDPEDADPCGNT